MKKHEVASANSQHATGHTTVPQHAGVLSSTNYAFSTVLPVHLIAEIFSCLPMKDRIRTERVCRLWQSILRNHSWTKTRTLTYWTIRDHPADHVVECNVPVSEAEILSIVSRCGMFVRFIDFEPFSPNDVKDDFVEFAPHCPNLRSLHLRLPSLSNKGLVTIAGHCPLLEDFTYSGCFLEDPDIGISELLSNCQHMNNIQIDMEIVRPFSDPPIAFEGKHCFPMLPETVTILGFSNLKITKELLEIIFNRCPNLDCLLLGNNSSHSSTFPDASFPKTLSKLRLDLHNRTVMTNVCESIGRMNNLVELALQLTRIGPTGIDAIVDGCPQLKCLDLSYTECFGDSLGALSRLPNLTCLSVEQLLYYNRDEPEIAYYVNDGILNRIVERGCLRFLSLNYCTMISNAGVANIMDRNKKLVCLNLVGCHSVTVSLSDVLNVFSDVCEQREHERGESFDWYSIRKDIGDSIVVPPYQCPREPGRSSEGYSYKSFCSFIRSEKGSSCSTEKDEGRANRFPELHCWLEAGSFRENEFRLAQQRVAHPLMKLYYDMQTPCMRLSTSL